MEVFNLNTQTWLMIGAFLAVVLLTQIGRKEFTFRRALLPFIICGITVYLFVKEIPTSGSNMTALIIMTIVGMILGGIMLFTVKVEFDSDNKAYVIAGIPYLSLWILGLGWRVVLAYYAQDWYPQKFIHFMISNHLDPNVIAPAFVLFTIAMVVVRTIGIVIKIQRCKRNLQEN
jgi:membrane protein CcdC involved in cytochrome C biogenesis